MSNEEIDIIVNAVVEKLIKFLDNKFSTNAISNTYITSGDYVPFRNCGEGILFSPSAPPTGRIYQTGNETL